VPERHHSLGGRGGGGIQLANLSYFLASGQSLSSNAMRRNLSFYSFGGGGGCGTCESVDLSVPSNQTSISCGFQPDDDAVMDRNISRELVTDFQKYVSKYCQKVSVTGGGGSNRLCFFFFL
jgi:hypothetical protein